MRSRSDNHSAVLLGTSMKEVPYKGMTVTYVRYKTIFPVCMEKLRDDVSWGQPVVGYIRGLL